ncbi:MAG: FG-GAP-like repeat-containing protein [Candidatus Thorarchaeota archaeon]
MKAKRIIISLLTSILIMSFLFGSSELSSQVANLDSPNLGDAIGLPAGMDSYINWTFAAGSLFDSDPVAVDLDTDGTLEVLVGCNNQILYCFDHLGSIEWSYTTDEWILGSPSVADLDKDGDLEIIIGTRGSTLYCFDSDGEIEWTFPSDGWAWSTACLADINLDGNLEILFTTNTGMLYCLNNTGDEMWYVDTGPAAEVPPAVGDFDEDGIPDIVVGNHNGRVYCYNSTGHALWDSYAGGGIMNAAFCISDLDADGHLEIIIGTWDQNIYCIHHNGTERWSFPTGGDIDMSTAAAVDLDNDGTMEVLVGSNDNRLHCIDHNGNEEWYYATSGNIRGSPMVADLDGDGHLDIVVPSQDNYLYCIDYTGTFNWSENLGGSPWEDPCIADLDGDGVFEIIVSGYSNLQCISLTGVTTSGSAPWPCYLGSTHHIGWIDSDSDYLDDFSEDTYYHTSSSEPDSDLDSWWDGTEVFAGTDPLDINDFPVYPSYEISTLGSVSYEVAWGGSVNNGTHILIFGGQNSSGRIDSTLIYCIENNTSSVLQNQFPSGLDSPTAEYYDGKAYIFGGNNGGNLDTIQIFDMSTGDLTTSTSHLPAAACQIGSASNGTYVYLFGGFGSSPERKSTILGFDPATEDLVDTGASLPVGLSQTTPIFAGDVVYVFGGHQFGGSAHTYILKYDPLLNACTQISTEMPREISAMSGVWDGDDQIFLFGGALDGYSGSTHYDTIYIFNTTSEAIEEHPLTLPEPSIFHMAQYIDGRAYVIGGMTQSVGYLDDVVRFSPQSLTWPNLTVSRFPLSPSQSQSVQIIVNTSVSSSINQSILSYSIEGSPFTNLSMGEVGANWIGEIPAFPAYTLVEYNVYVQNGLWEWATSQLYAYIVADTEGPIISTVRAPVMPIHSDTVTINATVVDASTIEQVLLNYSSDNQETWTEVSMTQVGNNWIEYIPFFLAGTNVSYYVGAEDSEGNWGASEMTNYTVDDIQGPSIITSRSIQTPCIGEMVEVTAAVYDTSMVDTVWLVVRINNGSWTNYWMNSEGYLYSAFIPGHDLGTFIEYKVQANDTVGNWGISPIDAYSVVDCVEPTISLLTELSDAGQNEVVPIEVEVADPGGVKQVLLCYSLDSGLTFTNRSMGNVSGIWSSSIPMGVVGESVYFSIYAEDQSGNWELSQLYSYQIIDVLAPNVLIIITSNNSNQTETLGVEVEVTDDSDILSVVMRYTVDNWKNESELALDFQDGVWVIQIGFVDSTMTLQYRIVVEDAAHNIYESGIMFYTIVHTPYQAPPLDLALVAVSSGGIGVAIILIILFVRRKQEAL